MNSIHLFKCVLSERSIEAVAEVMRSGWTGQGPRVQQFEEDFSRYIGVKHTVALNSCTSALHLALMLLNLQQGDEVLSVPLTFVSTNHAILYVKATPVFVDVQLETGCIDPDDIERKITEKTRAIMVVHYGGYPCDMRRINEIARTYGLQVIEDCAHACGSMLHGEKIGSISSLNCFSFHSVKNLPTGGDGGCITTNNRFYYDKLMKMRWLGIDKSTFNRTQLSESNLAPKAYSWRYDCQHVGTKSHMNDITAAIGIEQLKLLDQENARRAEIVEMYRKELQNVPGITLMERKEGYQSSNHLCPIRAEKRDNLMDHFKNHDIHAGVHYLLNSKFKIYEPYNKYDTPNAERLESELISLPLHLALTNEDVQYVIDVIKKGW